jgi:hypothetical protein
VRLWLESRYAQWWKLLSAITKKRGILDVQPAQS